MKGAVRLAAASRQARQLQLLPGLTLADARARIPDLWVEESDPAADAALLEAIAEDCDRFTPVVVVDAPDGLLLDITGCDHLFGGEINLRAQFLQRMHRAKLHVRAAIASAPDSARALARYGRVGIVPPGGEAEAVRLLPVAALELEDAHRTALQRAGIKTIAHLADRPSLPFAARFGERMTLRLKRLLGEAETPLSPRRPAPSLWVEKRFADPIARAEDIEAALAHLVGEAVSRLEQERQGGRVFEAGFFRADGAVRRIAVRTGRALRDAQAVLRLFREKLDALCDPIDPGFGFDLIRISIASSEKLDSVQTSLDGGSIDADELADLAGRLAVRFGAMRILRFCARDTHNPERAAKTVCALEGDASFWPAPEINEPPMRPPQLFDPPQPVTVMAEIPDGPPSQFVWRKVSHRIRRAEGPERIAPEWWREGERGQTRDYYRIEDMDGRRFWLFRAGFYERGAEKPRWFLHGLFP